MSSENNFFIPYLSSLRQLAAQQHCRFGVVLDGSEQWNRDVCQHWIDSVGETVIFQLGGQELSGSHGVAFNKGQHLLGQECGLLIVDLSDGWDANSFSAALGTVIGGGLVVVLRGAVDVNNMADVWLHRALDELFCLTEQSTPSLPVSLHSVSNIDFSEQQLAVDNIVRVVEGHRKRPFVLTADRGRGKSSALGMAAAKLMKSRNINIVVTAPTLAAVSPVFQFAQQSLSAATSKRGFVSTSESSLRFVAPDEVLRQHPDCDLLLVDEAAALPLPILQRCVEQYHRVVFSSTIHGYEGSGRGFTLKFNKWLKAVRPQMRTQNLVQPIRWSVEDPLEAWHRKSFLLDFDFEPISESIDRSEIEFRAANKNELVSEPTLLHKVFSLLVNAHYQTSPNDLFHLLSDDSMYVYIATHHGTMVGCILAVQEGEIEDELIDDIQLGNRRPKGHLAPVTIANQLGFSVAARQASVRIMRIAVHPDLHNMGIGSELVSRFAQQQKCDYLSTSFGATAELVQFWRKCGFSPIKVGSQRDQASGCYSLLMVKGGRIDWLEQAEDNFYQHFIFELSDSLKVMEPEMVKALLRRDNQLVLDKGLVEHIRRYSMGGGNYESIAVWLHQLLIALPEKNVVQLSSLIIAKVLQRISWQECAHDYGLVGRKQIEMTMRAEIQNLLVDLQCKTIS